MNLIPNARTIWRRHFLGGRRPMSKRRRFLLLGRAPLRSALRHGSLINQEVLALVAVLVSAGHPKRGYAAGPAPSNPRNRGTSYFTFSQTSVVTLILPSLADGAGCVDKLNRSPSVLTSLNCVVPVHISFHEMSM
jgi:hypothetical protein